MFGMFGIGGPFFGGIFFDGGLDFIERGVELRQDTSFGLWRGAMALAGGVGSMPYGSPQGCRNYIGNLIDWRRACLAASKKPKVDDLPPGANSPSHGTRGRSYLNQFFYTGSLKGVEQEDVIKSILGPNASPEEKDALRKKDNIMRALVQKVVGMWLHDPVARGQFLRKWQMARNDVDRVRALLDPMGDGAYLQTLAQMGVPGALNEREDPDVKWQKIAGWFSSELGEAGALNSLAAEALNIVHAEGWEGDTVLDQRSYAGKTKETYISDLVDKGYTREEAALIMQPANMTGAEAEEIVRNMNDQRQSKSMIESKEKELEQERATLKDEIYQKKEYALQKKQKEEQIAANERELARMKEERAKQFLQDYMKVAKARFGKTAEDFGYESGKLPDDIKRKDVPGAIQWVYGKLGRQVVLPEGAAQSTSADNAAAVSPTPSGSSGAKSALPTKTGEVVTEGGTNKKFHTLEKPFFGMDKNDTSKAKREFKYVLKDDRGKVTDYCTGVDSSTCVPVDRVTKAPTSQPQISNKETLRPPVSYNGVSYNWKFTFKNQFGEAETYYSPEEPALTKESADTWVPKSAVDAAEAEKAKLLTKGEVKEAVSTDAEGKVAGSYPGRKITVRRNEFIVDYQVDDDGKVTIKKLVEVKNNKDWTTWVNS